jgi:hypothetical protein
MLAVEMVASTDDASGWAGSMSPFVATSVN